MCICQCCETGKVKERLRGKGEENALRVEGERGGALND